MAHTATRSVVRQLESLFEGGSVAGLSDRQLLERYLAGGCNPAGEAAFAALVGRHGPMVLGVCRQFLGDAQHAEDAFQAVFLVLAQKARTIRDPDLLGNWLYGVAIRTARCAKQQIGRRRKREEGNAMKGPGPGACHLAEPTAPPADQPAIDREQAEAIHGEVDRLPRSFRLPVVLCYFEGLTLDEAARRLRCPAGTLRSRLARARDKLGRGLSRRGVTLPATALTAFLVSRSASASISPLLCNTTTQAATTFAAHHAASGVFSASAATLAQEVLRTMFVHKLRLTALSLLLMTAVATGAGLLTHSLAMKEEVMENPAAPEAKIPPGDADRPRPVANPDDVSLARMTVAGRVLDPDGKPVRGAVVDLVARPRAPWVGASEDVAPFTLLSQGQSDADGQYRLDAPRTASTRVFEVIALAAVPGYGLGWAELNPDAEQPSADLKLPPEQTVRVRLVDVSGAPARGVEVRVLGLGRPDDQGHYKGVTLWANAPKGLRTWPQSVATDDNGRITLHGIGRSVGLNLGVRDLRFAQQDLQIAPDSGAAGKETTLALEPAKIIEGRVLAADTGQPIPNAIVSASAQVMNEQTRGSITTKFRADAKGRFTINPITSTSYTLGAFPTGGEPYLIQQDELKWTKGTIKATHDIKVRRGVLIRGKATEVGTTRPLPASSIQFIPTSGGDNVISGWPAIVASTADGSFQIAVPPGKGHLLVFGPTSDYVLGEIGARRLYNDQPGGKRYHAHAIIPYEAKAGDSPLEVTATLRPGVTIKGRVEGPDGQTITDGFILSTLRIEAFNPFWRGDYQIPIRDGRFELHGLAPEASTRIHVLDPEHEWGASVDITGNQSGRDLTIRLQPCGKATARFVGPDGKPIAKHRPHFEFVATPGPSPYSRNQRDRAELASDVEFVANIDRKHYWNAPRTDDEGRVSLISLIPGALYRIIDFSTVTDQDKGAQVRKEFTIKSGETLDLGEIQIDKPDAQ
ncbi:RNA polymerase sigma factor, sigma-70 family [Singulisphaera sp. GP187]|uniref:sigma-70 family RNA polymerase sigma factor n=1 Tax=Singulisphaera sp. GP187 TaxID=1882752 RepID=UPI00092780A6|nr:sigma-70 family RNA polymerase sigma factor [Singulisphaera sp. GP187]SIN70411.1 RNA polymerase sigma factor, sigma-70 family [Singulisphaera sp. GP187]